MGEDGEEEDDDEGDSFPTDDVDWDKYLHFGENEDDEEDENVARAAALRLWRTRREKSGSKSDRAARNDRAKRNRRRKPTTTLRTVIRRIERLRAMRTSKKIPIAKTTTS